MSDLIQQLAKTCVLMLEGMCYLSSILWWIMHFDSTGFYWTSLGLVIGSLALGFTFTIGRWVIFDTINQPPYAKGQPPS